MERKLSPSRSPGPRAARAAPRRGLWPGSGDATPNAAVRHSCGSASTSSTRRPRRIRACPRLTAVVVLPTPPFWFAIAMQRGMGLYHSDGIPASRLTGISTCTGVHPFRVIAPSTSSRMIAEASGFERPWRARSNAAFLSHCHWSGLNLTVVTASSSAFGFGPRFRGVGVSIAYAAFGITSST